MDESKDDHSFLITGMLNAPQLATRIYFYSGAISLFDGVYELMPDLAQQHFFKDYPEYQSEQYVDIDTRYNQISNQRDQKYDLNIRAIRYKEDDAVDLDAQDEFPIQSIVIVYDGMVDDLNSSITVFEYGIEQSSVMIPNFEFRGMYDVSFSDDSSLASASNYGLRLLLPSIVVDGESSDFERLGRQQVNSLFRRSIRPYERRIAKRVGLYDFRLDYDLGTNVLGLMGDTSASQDLLGAYFVMDIYNQQLFLNVRTDVDLSTEENAYEKGLKVTQFELKYYLLSQFSIGLKNINEYSDVAAFDPRFSLNYGYSF